MLCVVDGSHPFSNATARITLSADNVNMVKIVGTKRGRIFMGGSDGSLYELEYQVIQLGMHGEYLEVYRLPMLPMLSASPTPGR